MTATSLRRSGPVRQRGNCTLRTDSPRNISTYSFEEDWTRRRGPHTANFDTYSVGAVFEGNKLNPVQRVCEEPDAVAIAEHAPAIRDNHVAFLYGTCTVPPEDESSCPLPISVQVFPACERNRSLYTRYPAPDGRVYDFTPIKIRGTEAAVFDDGLRIEVYTGNATVVIWGTDAARVGRAANALRGVHAGHTIGVSDPLPGPERGAQEGLLRCG